MEQACGTTVCCAACAGVCPPHARQQRLGNVEILVARILLDASPNTHPSGSSSHTAHPPAPYSLPKCNVRRDCVSLPLVGPVAAHACAAIPDQEKGCARRRDRVGSLELVGLSVGGGRRLFSGPWWLTGGYVAKKPLRRVLN